MLLADSGAPVESFAFLGFGKCSLRNTIEIGREIGMGARRPQHAIGNP